MSQIPRCLRHDAGPCDLLLSASVNFEAGHDKINLTALKFSASSVYFIDVDDGTDVLWSIKCTLGLPAGHGHLAGPAPWPGGHQRPDVGINKVLGSECDPGRARVEISPQQGPGPMTPPAISRDMQKSSIKTTECSL